VPGTFPASAGFSFVNAMRSTEQKGHDMNWDIIEGKWNEYKGKAQAQWGKLTDDDLDVINGRRVELSGKIQQRYGLAKEEAERQIDDWTRRH
jgi:uncharacterized protein YjbJ (UPF0337 family)